MSDGDYSFRDFAGEMGWDAEEFETAVREATTSDEDLEEFEEE